MMNISHYKLKDRVLEIISKHAEISVSQDGSAIAGAQSVLCFMRNHLNEEIYILYLNKCEKEFNSCYKFEHEEPFVKGLMEARYFIIRMFNISYMEYFKFMAENTRYDKSTLYGETGNKKLSA
ncbi:MAG: hypothetical protein JXB00_19180 [Bacteroidales bacterium]|nr:hypothetical protein [Bacteroidales bacterium]